MSSGFFYFNVKAESLPYNLSEIEKDNYLRAVNAGKTVILNLDSGEQKNTCAMHTFVEDDIVISLSTVQFEGLSIGILIDEGGVVRRVE